MISHSWQKPLIISQRYLGTGNPHIQEPSRQRTKRHSPLLPILAPPRELTFFESLFHPSPYTSHKFHSFQPGAQTHITHIHSLQHSFFCHKNYCHYHNKN